MFIHFKCTNWLLKIYIKFIIVLRYFACFNLINCVVVSYMLNDCGSVIVCYRMRVRYQKRQKLQFDTKLDMNSLFWHICQKQVRNLHVNPFILTHHTALACNKIQCWPLGGSTAMRWEQHQQPLKETLSSLQRFSLLSNMTLY